LKTQMLPIAGPRSPWNIWRMRCTTQRPTCP